MRDLAGGAAVHGASRVVVACCCDGCSVKAHVMARMQYVHSCARLTMIRVGLEFEAGRTSRVLQLYWATECGLPSQPTYSTYSRLHRLR